MILPPPHISLDQFWNMLDGGGPVLYKHPHAANQQKKSLYVRSEDFGTHKLYLFKKVQKSIAFVLKCKIFKNGNVFYMV